MERTWYKAVIANERFNVIQLIKLAFLAVNALVVIYLSLLAGEWIPILFSVLAILVAVKGFRLKINKKEAPIDISVFGFLLIVIALSILQYHIWVIAVTIVYFLSKLVKEKFEFTFSTEDIYINTKPARRIHWEELNNVVLKDDMLTVDFKNDKLIQSEIIPSESDTGTEAEFNQFCSKQLAMKR